MGGQACVFYGAAEFSRDCDIVLFADSENYDRLTDAIGELQAECIAVPPMDWKYLDKGHAIHFRCMHPDAHRIRLDVMTKMRGCDEFTTLWERRTSLQDSDGTVFEILGIEDLVKAKKTQRDKDWPMIRRLVDAHYAQFRMEPNDDRVKFWLREVRSPLVLVDIAKDNPVLVAEMLSERALLANAVSNEVVRLKADLYQEQVDERSRDEDYWKPLKAELEQMRHDRRR